MKVVSHVFVIRCDCDGMCDDPVEGIYMTLDSAKEALHDLYCTMFQDDDTTEADYDETFTIHQYPLYA